MPPHKKNLNMNSAYFDKFALLYGFQTFPGCWKGGIYKTSQLTTLRIVVFKCNCKHYIAVPEVAIIQFHQSRKTASAKARLLEFPS